MKNSSGFCLQESETVRNHPRQQPEERRTSAELGFLTAHYSKNFHLLDPEPEDKRYQHSSIPSSDVSIKDQPAPSVGEYVQESTVFPDQCTYAPMLTVTEEVADTQSDQQQEEVADTQSDQQQEEVADTQSDQQQEEAIAHENKENEANIVLVITGTSTELTQLRDERRNGENNSVTEKSYPTSTESREALNSGVSQDKVVDTCETRPTTAQINKISGMEVTSSSFGRPPLRVKTSIRSPSQSLPDIAMFGKKQQMLEKNAEKEEAFQKHPIRATFSAHDFRSVSSQYCRPFQKLRSEPTTIPLGTTHSQEILKYFNTVSSSGMGLNMRKVIKEDSWPADPLPRVFSSRSHARKHFERRHTISQTRLIPGTVAHQTCPCTTPCTRHSEQDAQRKTEKPSSSWEDSQPCVENMFQSSQYKHIIEKKATENRQYKQPTHEKVYQSNQRALLMADKASQCSQLRHHTEDKASQCSEFSPPEYSLSTTLDNQYTHLREWTSPQHDRYNQLSEEKCVPSQCHHRLQPGSSQSTRMKCNQFIFNITCTIGQIEIKNKTEYRPNQIEDGVKKP